MRRTALARDLVPVHEFRKDLATWLQRVEDVTRAVERKNARSLA